MISTSILRHGGRLAIVALAAIQLAACASAAKPEAMIATVPASAAPFPQGLQHAMCVRTVTGGQKTNALWVSKVDDQSFKTALNSSLGGAQGTAQVMMNGDRNEVQSINVEGRINGDRFNGSFSR